MLSKLRKNMRIFSIFLWIVAASFVGTIFLVWGKGSISGPSANEVATVNGLGITLFEFNREYDRVVRELKAQFGNQYSKFIKDKDIKLLALKNLIRRKLLLSEAEREGVKVSDWAVAKVIEKMPIFQDNGTFNVNLYKKVLAANHLTPEQFEKEVREDLTITKLMTVVNYSPSVTNFEVKKLYLENFGKRKFRYEEFPAEIDNVTLSEKELKSYYEKHKKKFEGKVEEKSFVVKISKDKPKALDEAERVFSLAKKGNFSELQKYKPEEVKRNIGKEVEFKEEGNFYKIYYKEKVKNVKSFEEVKEEIEKLLKERKAFELAKKNAETYLKEGKKLTKETTPMDKEEFLKTFSVINPFYLEKLFSLKVGDKLLIPTLRGYLIASPESNLKVETLDPKKEKEIRNYILSLKRESNQSNFLNLLEQKANIKINKQLLGL